MSFTSFSVSVFVLLFRINFPFCCSSLTLAAKSWIGMWRNRLFQPFPSVSQRPYALFPCPPVIFPCLNGGGINARFFHDIHVVKHDGRPHMCIKAVQFSVLLYKARRASTNLSRSFQSAASDRQAGYPSPSESSRTGLIPRRLYREALTRDQRNR